VGGGAGVTALNNCSSIVRSAWLFEKKEKTFFGKLSTDRCGNREREGTRVPFREREGDVSQQQGMGLDNSGRVEHGYGAKRNGGKVGDRIQQWHTEGW